MFVFVVVIVMGVVVLIVRVGEVVIMVVIMVVIVIMAVVIVIMVVMAVVIMVVMAVVIMIMFMFIGTMPLLVRTGRLHVDLRCRCAAAALRFVALFLRLSWVFVPMPISVSHTGPPGISRRSLIGRVMVMHIVMAI